MTKTFIIALFLLPCTVFAQFTITGKVLNHADSRPIEFVNVFLNNATIGGQTNADGIFTLHNVKSGKYQLVVSMMGYGAFSEPVLVTNANVTVTEIYLFPKVNALKEVKITANGDAGREKNVELFKSAFLGSSDIAKECKLVNPELLDLSYDEKSKTLTASSGDFLIVENKALGYRVKYLLSDFTLNEEQFYYAGTVLFEEMKGSDEQMKQWANKREDVYANSATHFLRAGQGRKLMSEGFRVYGFAANPERPADSLINAKIKLFASTKERQFRDSLSVWTKKLKLPKLLEKQTPVALSDDDIISNTNKQGIYALGKPGTAIYVIYDKLNQYAVPSPNHLREQNNTPGTSISFNAPYAFFDGNGTITNPGSVTYSGVWANKRIAELLPVNYELLHTEPPIDSTVFKKVYNSLKTYASVHNVEKAYLHFDKPYYAAGDNIYFKAYVTNQFYEPTALSTILNVELINPRNQIETTIKLKLKDGIAAGDIGLADTLQKGRYRIRAYTNVMRNAGEEYFFDKYISVVNEPAKVTEAAKSITVDKVQKAGASSSKSNQSDIDVQFFPEGGTMLNGAESQVAFKALAPTGLGTEIKGTITDEQGQHVADIASTHLGMGSFTMTPQAGKIYTANISYGGKTITVDLPKANDNGYNLHIDNSDSLSVKVIITAGQQYKQEQVNLIGQAGGVIYSYTAGKFVNKKLTAIIPKNLFPDGIIQFTLFSADAEPVNERLVFVRNPDQLNLKLMPASSASQPRRRVGMSLESKDWNHVAATGNFSVAVTDETNVPVDENDESTILSHLLLTSDLKGYVERPNYYFNSKNKNAVADLDMLLLTQGYHRFEWKPVLGGKPQPDIYQPEKITSVSGQVKTKDGKPLANTQVSLFSVSNVFFSLDTVTDQNGRFRFDGLLLNDIRYSVQATDKEVRKNAMIEVDNLTPPKIKDNKDAPETNAVESDNMPVFFEVSKNFHVEQVREGFASNAVSLKGVEIKSKKAPPKLKNSLNFNGPRVANEIILGDQIPKGSLKLSDALRGHLHGIQFVGGTPVYARLRSMVIIDGMEIVARNVGIANGGSSVGDIMDSISIDDIASVEVLTDASLCALYGSQGGGGVIIITTKRGDDLTADGSKIKQTFAYYTPPGFYKARMFYSPRYEASGTNTLPDLRTTIYWNPNVVTDESGNTSFDFFNADAKGTYRVVVEGMDDKGHLGRLVYRYKVE